jgi:uncharacterized protein YgiM (DUF1202 family)
MKMNFWLLCGIFLAASLSAQQVTNAPLASGAAAPPPAASSNSVAKPTASAPKTTATPKSKTPAPKKAPVVKSVTPIPKPVAPELKTVPLKPGPALVIASNVNVRGQARLMGEVVTRITRGQEVTVLEEIELKNSGPEEPSAWAKIALPAGADVWVHSMFIDPTEKTVTTSRLNLRAGPGENYSVIGRVDKGTKVKDLDTKGDWMQIEPLPGAYAFVAAQYLSQEAEAAAEIAAAAPTPAPTTPARPEPQPEPSTPVVVPEPGTNVQTAAVIPPPVAEKAVENTPLTPATVTEPKQIAESTTDAPVPKSEVPAPTTPSATPGETTPAMIPNTEATEAGTNAVAETETPAAPEEPVLPRIVSREGVVRGSVSIQAPSHFELYSPESGRIINYLYNPSKDLDLARYKGLRIIVTGEEGLDERWRNTPLLTIQKIRVLE